MQTQGSNQDPPPTAPLFTLCAYAGDSTSNWAWFEKQKGAHINIDFRFTGGDLRGIHACPGFNNEAIGHVHMAKLGPSVIVKDFRGGVASDFWHLYESDIALAADLGALTALLQLCMCRHEQRVRPSWG